jgi:hypothetical protein
MCVCVCVCVWGRGGGGVGIGWDGKLKILYTLAPVSVFPVPSASLRLSLLVLAPCSVATSAVTYILSFILSVLLH